MFSEGYRNRTVGCTLNASPSPLNSMSTSPLVTACGGFATQLTQADDTQRSGRAADTIRERHVELDEMKAWRSK
jgi:hypothetical protein